MQTASFRLPPKLLRSLRERAQRLGVTRSTVVRDALAMWLSANGDSPPSTGVLLDLLVTWRGSGRGNLATEGERILRERFRARRRSR